MKKTFLTLALAFLAGCVGTFAQEAEKPLLTIGCVSDVHNMNNMITPSSGKTSDITVRSSLTEVLNRWHSEENVDVIIFGGDTESDKTIKEANSRMVHKRMIDTMHDFFPEGKQPCVLYVAGNHEYEVANFDAIPKPYNAYDPFEEVLQQDLGPLTSENSFYEDADNGNLGKTRVLAAYHYNLYGLDFVVLNCGKHFFNYAWDYQYSEESVAWVKNKLDEIYAEDPDKTVFFCLHVPFEDSNSLNSGKGMKDVAATKALKAALAEHPNLIMLYGHDHGKDTAFSRTHTSQRVTHYDINGNVIATTDSTHVDGPVYNDEGEPVENFSANVTLYNDAIKKYLSVDDNNITVSADEMTFPMFGTDGDFTMNMIYNDATRALHIGSNGRYSRGDATTFNLYDEAGKKVITPEDGKAYYIVSKYLTSYYALSNELYSPGSTSQRMNSVKVEITEDLASITPLTDGNCLWKITVKSQEEEDQPDDGTFKSGKFYFHHTATGKYLGYNTYNLTTVDDPNPCVVETTGTNLFSITPAGAPSSINGAHMYFSSSSKRFSGNGSVTNFYLLKVEDPSASTLTLTPAAAPEIGGTYVVATLYSGQLYAVTGTTYSPGSDSQRVNSYVLGAMPASGSISVSASTVADCLWTLEEVKDTPTPAGQSSFFSIFMGSLRYYYNTIDTGDPTDMPTVVQALMLYVYPDRVELELKNYNKTGLLSGIQVNKRLATYTAIRPINVTRPEPDGISSAVTAKSSRNQVCDLSGRRTSTASHGCYIVNGRKVVK